MTPKQVALKRVRIESKISEWQLNLKSLQELCTHPSLEKEHGANTGNYDPHADCYWTDYSCPDCGKRWTEFKD